MNALPATQEPTPAVPRARRAVATVQPASAPILSEGAAMLEIISRASRDPATDVSKLERLMAMYERIGAREAEQSFNAAMSDAQTEMRPVAADAQSQQAGKKYASYAQLDRALRPIFTGHGFALSFNTEPGAPENCVRVVCYATHRGGHSRKYEVDMPADGKGARGGDVMSKTHATASALSYGARYLLKLIFNVAVGETDDDGNAAGGTKAPTDNGPITRAQADELLKMIKDTGSDIGRFCRYMGVEAVPDIKAGEFPRAVTMLTKKQQARP